MSYPKVMVHPQHAPAVIGPRIAGLSGRVSYGQGAPERYPNTMVENEDQEARERARGYLAVGEAPPPPAEFAEYPLMMAHPDHKDAIPDEMKVQLEPNGTVNRWVIPGSPEEMPHWAVANAAEEAEWAGKGYLRMGISDPHAASSAKASPYAPGRTHSEYPKWVPSLDKDGKQVRDADGNPLGVMMQAPGSEAGGVDQYPKWIASHGVEVANAKEEAELLGLTEQVLQPDPKASAPKPIFSPTDALLVELQQELARIRADIASSNAKIAEMAKPKGMTDAGKARISAAAKARHAKAKAAKEAIKAKL